MDGNLPESSNPLVPAQVLAALHTHAQCCALRFCQLDISAAQLLDKVLALAAALHQQGIGPGCRVGVCLERSPEVPLTLLALWCRRAVYVPLEPGLPGPRLQVMAATCGLQMLITTPQLRAALTMLPCPLLLLAGIDFALPPCPPDSVQVLPNLPDDEACILFTSGSTGTPKAVTLTHGNIAALFAGILPLLQLPAQPRVLALAGFGFDIALFELLAPLLCGGTLVMADAATARDPVLLARLADAEAIDVLQATPSRWDLLNRCDWNPHQRTVVAIATGEALSKTTAGALLARTSVLWNLYGPTECTLWTTAWRVTPADLAAAAPALVCIGTALPACRLLLAAGGTTGVAGPGDAGELLIAGPALSPGYLGLPEVTAQAFAVTTDTAGERLRCYHSGDLCRMDAAGRLHYLGRRDRQVKYNGHRIELDEISLCLRRHPSLQDAVCLLRPASVGHASQLFACVVFRRDQPNKDQRQLHDWLATTLPAWMLPRRYLVLAQLPLTANGKLDHAALQALAAPTAGRICTDVSSSLAHQVAEVFCTVLELDTIGLHDSFFDNGGSSMLAATLLLALNNRFACQLSLRQLLATPPTVSSTTSLLLSAGRRTPAP